MYIDSRYIVFQGVEKAHIIPRAAFERDSEHVELRGTVAYIHSATPTLCLPPVFAEHLEGCDPIGQGCREMCEFTGI